MRYLRNLNTLVFLSLGAFVLGIVSLPEKQSGSVLGETIDKEPAANTQQDLSALRGVVEEMEEDDDTDEN